MMMLNGTQLKASTVLQAMVAGLKKSKDDPNFTVYMGTYGTVKNLLCYGCCATLALAEMFGDGKSASEMMLSYARKFNQLSIPDVLLSDVIESDPLIPQDSLPENLDSLEIAVNDARLGDVSALIEFLTGEVNTSFNDRWELESSNWGEQLPIVEATIAEMIKAGY